MCLISLSRHYRRIAIGEGRIRTPVGRGRLESWRARTGGSEVAGYWVVSVIAFYEKVIKVKADVAAYLINCFPSV